MATLHQGDIIWVNLDPAKGTETKMTRPCIVISNEHYNRYFNTVLVIPISSSPKYSSKEKYQLSPLFITVNHGPIHGTALLQHVRAIDAKKRIDGSAVAKMTKKEIQMICQRIIQFF